MVNPVWPSSLPRPLKDGFRRGWEDPRTKRQRETGPPGYSRRYSLVAKPMTLSFNMTRDQFATLEEFFEVDLQNGSLIFEMPDPITDGWPAAAGNGIVWLYDDNTPVLVASILLMLWGDQPPEIVSAVGADAYRVVCPMVIMP